METLVKEGKKFNLKTSTLVAKSEWFTHFKLQRQLIYKSSKGTYFQVQEEGKSYHDTHSYVVMKDGSKIGLGNVTSDRHSMNKTPNYSDDVSIENRFVSEILTEESVRDTYEYILSGKSYTTGYYGTSYTYNLLCDYEELFNPEEA